MATGNDGGTGDKKGRVWGFGFLAFGILSILDSFSPVPIPTVGITAIVSGLLFSLVGAIILFKDRIPLIGQLREKFRQITMAPQKIRIDPLLPVRILKLAKAHGGVLTLSEVAIELDLPLEVAEAGMTECLNHGYATSDYDMTKELTYYRFIEYAPKGENPPEALAP